MSESSRSCARIGARLSAPFRRCYEERVTSRDLAKVLGGLLTLCAAGCGDGPSGADGGPHPDGGAQAHADANVPTMAFGEVHEGQYHLGPVEWTGSFTNACEPYPDAIRAIEGELLAGVSNEVGADGRFCDACVRITTGRGRSIVARVVTYGVAGAPGDLDLSQAAFDALTEGEYPRSMQWQLTTCPTVDPIYLQFQTAANPDWTSFWVRNPRIGVDHVDVMSERHASFFTLRRETDGTLNDDSGFGSGPFTLRIVAMDGSELTQTFSGFAAGDLLMGSANFP